MTVEIRYVGAPHGYECDFGPLGPNRDAKVTHPMEPLIIVFGDQLRKVLAADGPIPRPRLGGMASATVDGTRIFYHVHHDGQRTTWELFEAHITDHPTPTVGMYVGKRAFSIVAPEDVMYRELHLDAASHKSRDEH